MWSQFDAIAAAQTFRAAFKPETSVNKTNDGLILLTSIFRAARACPRLKIVHVLNALL